MGKLSNRFRLPKSIHKQHKNIGEISTSTDDRIERHFFRRLANLAHVRRFVFGWLLLMGLILFISFLQFGFLREKYQALHFVPGGSFTEGIVGTYTNANPIYASSSVDSSVSKLLFSGLFAYDSQQSLAPNLAESIQLDKTEKKYTVILKENLYWHDGQPLTADDVVFTFKTIQNPDAESYLLPNWEGVKIERKDDRTVIFTLPGTLSSFPDSLTTGIIPEHILKDINPEQLRSNDFNTVKPVGSGPFKYDTVEVEKGSAEGRGEQIGLLANDRYFKNEPGIKRYVISTYKSQGELLKAYGEKKVDAISGLGDINKDYAKDEQNNIYSVAVAGQTMIFFNNSQGALSDVKVRKALVLGANRQKIIESTGQVLKTSDEPFLRSQLGYDNKFSQKTNNAKAAKKLLDQVGWKLKGKAIRTNGKNEDLRIKLFALSNDEYGQVTAELKRQWAEIGVDAEIHLQQDEDLKTTVSAHGYDALLSTLSIGADPDVFAFWHSSQIDVRSKSRLNFSEYKSREADAALEAGRSRSDPAIRKLKYKPFLVAWNRDNPALALYQPNFTFIVRAPFEGFDSKSLVNPIDRYADVNEWLIRQERR
jgi:peptide/nickel transport system substrate-binding protein